jgi:hypothetical protein
LQIFQIATELVPSPAVGWLVPTTKSKNMWRAGLVQTANSRVYEFTAPQINQTFPLWLNIGMALPRYDCWVSVCKHKTMQSPTSVDLGEQFVLDILPASVDGLYWWNQLGAQIDHDGDGIPRSQDPNDTKWDTDGDGVPDKREIEYGSSPTHADRDGDG